MGTTKSKQHIYYDPTSVAELIDETRKCRIYRNQKEEQFEKYLVENKGDLDFENKYQYRIKNCSPYLVDAYCAKTAQNKFGCSASNQYQIVTQRIPIRFSELKNLSPFEGLTIANRALKGFQQIFKSQGILLVKDTMIGINKQSIVKVWMNSNFALNEIEQLPILHGVIPQPEKENIMVGNIIQLVSSRTKKEQQWNDFVDDKYKQGNLGFEKAIQLTETHLSRIDSAKKDLFGQRLPISQSMLKTVGLPVSCNTNQVNKNLSFSNPFSRQSPPMRPNERIVHSPNVTVSSLPYMPASIQLNPFSNNPTINSSPIGKIPTMSTLKNKIIHGPHVNNSNQIYQPNINTSYPKSSIIKSHQPYNHQNNSMQSKFMSCFSNNSFTPLPQRLQGNNKLKYGINYQDRPLIYSNSTVSIKPRSISQGKPIVKIGNKTFGGNYPSPSLTSPCNNNINHNQISVIGPSIASPFNKSTHNLKASFVYHTSPQRNNKVSNQSFQSLQQPNNNPSPQMLPKFSHNIAYSPQKNYNTNNESNDQPSLKTQISPTKQKEQQLSQTEQNKIINHNFSHTQTQTEEPVQINLLKVEKNEEKNNNSVGLVNQNSYEQGTKLKEVESYVEHVDGQVQKGSSNLLSYSEKPNEQIQNNMVSESQEKEPEIKVQHQNQQSYPVYMEDSLKNAKIEVIQSIKNSNTGSGRQVLQKTQKSESNNSSKEKDQQNPKYDFQSQRKKLIFGNSGDIGKQENKKHTKSSEKLVILTEVKDGPIQEYQTPVFNRQKREEHTKCLFGITFNKNSYSSRDQEQSQQESDPRKYHQMPMQLNKLSTIQESDSKSQIIVKFDKERKQQNNLIDRPQNRAKNNLMLDDLLKNQVNFKNAVHQTASNIRMETSKISIKNSGDLKNIISYKDLMNLLKNVRRQQ